MSGIAPGWFPLCNPASFKAPGPGLDHTRPHENQHAGSGHASESERFIYEQCNILFHFTISMPESEAKIRGRESGKVKQNKNNVICMLHEGSKCDIYVENSPIANGTTTTEKSQNDANQSAQARAKADLRRSRGRAGNGAVFNEYNLQAYFFAPFCPGKQPTPPPLQITTPCYTLKRNARDSATKFSTHHHVTNPPPRKVPKALEFNRFIIKFN